MSYRLGFFFILLFAFSCIHDPISPLVESEDVLHLKWNSSYEDEKMEDAIIGLNWTLSHLGGTNTQSATNGLVITDQIITLNLPQIGLPTPGYAALFSLHQVIKNSEEYVKNGHIDLGRYITLLLGSSAHYYRILDMPFHLRDLISKYQMQPLKGLVNNSAISGNHRIISFSESNALNQFFLSVEIDPISKKTLEFETIEILPNGQLRFGIFDADSLRLDVADPAVSTSGKPAKCMWCHESKINPLFTVQTDSMGFLPQQQLKDSLIYFQEQLLQAQMTLVSGVVYSKTQEHVQMELQYIMFKHPTPMRLANEWQMTENEVTDLLAAQTRTTYPEFPFLEAGYAREAITIFAPVNSLLTSLYVREPSPVEINYLD